jgi:hypothetical protein
MKHRWTQVLKFEDKKVEYKTNNLKEEKLSWKVMNIREKVQKMTAFKKYFWYTILIPLTYFNYDFVPFQSFTLLFFIFPQISIFPEKFRFFLTYFPMFDYTSFDKYIIDIDAYKYGCILFFLKNTVQT